MARKINTNNHEAVGLLPVRFNAHLKLTQTSIV